MGREFGDGVVLIEAASVSRGRGLRLLEGFFVSGAREAPRGMEAGWGVCSRESIFRKIFSRY